MTIQTVSQESPAESGKWLVPLAGFAALYVPTYVDLARSLWLTDEQGQGPVILLVVAWLFWNKRQALYELPFQPAVLTGWMIMIAGIALYVVGRSQDVLLFEIGSQIPMMTGILLLMQGVSGVKLMWFPLLFFVFMVPMPGIVVDTLTLPMKTMVSWATDHILFGLGYPISRAGVILQIGQYKLFVADACAGLHTLFMLEALGLFYLHVMHHDSWFRNVVLTISIVPISFAANTIRVIVLSLITYHFGDEAGQGFLHGFAGLVLFLSALLLIIGVDVLLQFITKQRHSGGADDASL